MKRIMFAVLCTMLAGAGQAQTRPVVKIGMITTLSTPAGYVGEEVRDGFRLAVKEGNGALGGAPVELLVADDGLNPATAKEIAGRMLQQDGVKIFSGTIFSVIALGLVPDLMRAGAFYIGANTGATDFDGKNCHPNYFVASWHNEGAPSMAGLAANNVGAKRLVSIVANYYAGKESLAALKTTYKGQVVDEILVKLNQTDYASEISQIKSDKPDAIYSFLPGGMGISFLRQMHQAGLSGITHLNGTTIDNRALAAVGEAGRSVVGSTFWGPEFDNPSNKRFVAAFREAYKRDPLPYAAQGYDAAHMIGAALQATKGNVDDASAFRAALRNQKFDSVRGKFSLGKSQHPVQDWYMTTASKSPSGAYYLKTGPKLVSDLGSPYAAECAMKP